jgi:acetolactate synthase-1/2/3 large subunit
MYGTIRMHQERRYPGRVSSTDLANPDFVALARALGAHAERVSTTEEFAAAFDRAQAPEAQRCSSCASILLRSLPRPVSPWPGRLESRR